MGKPESAAEIKLGFLAGGGRMEGGGEDFPPLHRRIGPIDKVGAEFVQMPFYFTFVIFYNLG